MDLKVVSKLKMKQNFEKYYTVLRKLVSVRNWNGLSLEKVKFK